jgi:hypothetical protein
MSAPASPSDFAMTSQCIPSAGTTVSARFTWTAVATATSYRLERWTGSAWVFAASLAAASTFYDVTALTAATGTQYQLRAQNSDGNSSYVNSSFTTASRVASIGSVGLPTSLGVGTILSTSATLTWLDGSGADSDFEVGLKDLTTTEETIYSATGLLTAFILPIVPGRTYQVRMRAVAKLSGGSIAATAWTSAEEFTAAGSLALIALPSEITLAKDRPTSISFGIFVASGGVVFHWYDRPAGLTVTDEGETVAPSVIQLSGTPIAGGIYDSLFQIQGSSFPLTSIPVRFLVSGDGVIAAFHANPDRIDLVIDTRTGEVTGHYFTGTQSALPVSLGIEVAASVFLRDGNRYLSEGITEVSLAVQVESNFDTPSLFTARNIAPVIDTYGSAFAVPLPFTPEGATLRQIVVARQAGPGPATDGGAVRLSARLTYVRSGVTRRSEPFTLAVRPS